MPNLEQAIRERAYQLWLEGGCADGNAEAHWLAAQREILAASLGTVARVSLKASVEPTAKPSTRKRRRVA